MGNVLAHLGDRFSGEFQIVVDHPPPHQYLRICVELIAGLEPEQAGDLVPQAAHLLRERLSFRADVELVAYGTLPRTEQKARRVIRTYLEE